MAKKKAEESKRITVTFSPAVNEKLERLAKVEGKKTAVVAREILIDFLETHDKEIEEAQKAHATYSTIMKKLHSSQQSLFD